MKNFYKNYLGNASVWISKPNLHLIKYIERYTIYQNNSENFEDIFFRALPNGKVTIFLHLYGNKILIRFINGEEYEMDDFIFGIFEPAKTPYIKVKTHLNLFKGIAITLTYNGIYQLLGIPLIETTNVCLPLSGFLVDYKQELKEKIERSSSPKETIHILNSFFINLSQKKKYQFPEIINNTSKLLQNGHNFTSIENISNVLNLSYKSLYRLFSKHIGMGPKTFLKILRFDRACSILQSQYPNNNDWKEIVYYCGYYDQAHFINEFKSIMKESPYHFLKSCDGYFYINRAFNFV